VIMFMQQAGFEPRYGRRVVAELAAAGLTDVRGAGRALVIDSRSPGCGPGSGCRPVVARDADRAAARFAEDRRVHTPLMMAGIGRR
jgi:hypothetical protein